MESSKNEYKEIESHHTRSYSDKKQDKLKINDFRRESKFLVKMSLQNLERQEHPERYKT